MNLGPKPYVLIIGRPNVGKSTLFNRLIEEKKAITSEMPGTTRDILASLVSWQGRDFTIIDTGGLDIILPKKLKSLSENKIKKMDDLAGIVERKIYEVLKEAELVLFVTDANDGPMPQEKKISLVLRKLGRPIILVVNKADNPGRRTKATSRDWLTLSFGEPTPVSAINGSGTGDLLDQIVAKLPAKEPEATTETVAPLIKPRPIKIAIIGKPNVGKSSLVNALLGEERVLVSELPYTTRESIDTYFEYKDQPFILIDTAGIRKKGHIPHGGVERDSVKKSLGSVKDADIVFLVTEVDKRLTVQDSHLAGLIVDNNKGIVVIANKWDLIENKDTNTQTKFIDYYYTYFPYLSFAPLAFVSAKTHEKTGKLHDLAIEIYNERKKMADEETLYKIIKSISKDMKLRTIKQVGINPPQFLIKSNRKPPYPGYLVNAIEKKIRQSFDFLGTPIKVIIESTRR